VVLLLDRVGYFVFCWSRNWSSHISVIFGRQTVPSSAKYNHEHILLIAKDFIVKAVFWIFSLGSSYSTGDPSSLGMPIAGLPRATLS
jgi:hypothetical protein